MQEEVENRTLTLVVSGTKFTGPGIPEQCDSDENGEPDNEQPPWLHSKDRQKQNAGGLRLLVP